MITLDPPRPLYGPVDERPVNPIPPSPLPAASRSHHYGEGQTQRTVTQDEQDRLASCRQGPRALARQLNPT